MKNFGVMLAILAVSGCAGHSKNPSSNPSKSAASAPKPEEKPATKTYSDQPQFVVECRYEGQPFSVSFQSKSGKLQNQDMSVSLLFEKTEVPITISPGWYHAVDSVASFPSFCDGVPAYRVDGTEQFLLIFNLDQKIDQKPAYPETTLVLIDLKSKRILSKVERVGKLKALENPRYSIIPAPNGFQVRLIRDARTGAEDWKQIIVKKGSLTAKWRPNKKSKEY